MPYKTLGITRQENLKQKSAHAAPGSGLSAQGWRRKMNVKSKRAQTGTVSTTGAGNGHSPMIFLTEPRQNASAFPVVANQTRTSLRNPLPSNPL